MYCTDIYYVSCLSLPCSSCVNVSILCERGECISVHARGNVVPGERECQGVRTPYILMLACRLYNILLKIIALQQCILRHQSNIAMPARDARPRPRFCQRTTMCAHDQGHTMKHRLKVYPGAKQRRKSRRSPSPRSVARPRRSAKIASA